MRATDDNQAYAKDISTRIGKTIYSFYLETVIEGLLDLLDGDGKYSSASIYSFVSFCGFWSNVN